LVDKNDIQEYIKHLPPTPEILNQTLLYLNTNDLTKAAQTAKKDRALSSYIKSLVNKPIYGFKSEITNIAQAFSILGIGLAKQSLYNYSLSLLLPDRWRVFTLNKALFYDLQASLSIGWHKILQYLDVDDSDIETAIILAPASVIICESLFQDHIQEVNLLKSSHNLSYNEILYRLTSLDLFDISAQIAKIWGMSKASQELIIAFKKASAQPQINILAKWMYLLLFFEFSKSDFVEAGLNDFIEFKPDFVSDIYEEFAKLMDIT